MKRNCNLELRLLTPQNSMLDMEGEISGETKKMTVFYKGRVVCCDATEVQAREIILLARREVEKKYDPPAPEMNTPVFGAATGMSMKRSLQRFLEKRKSRAQLVTPYPVTRM